MENISKELIEHYKSNEVQEFMNAPLGDPNMTELKARSNGNAGYKEPAEHYLYFRKKPVVIEAVRVKEILRYWHQWSKLPEWVRSNYDAGKLLRKESGIELGVKTLEGYLTAGYNDWIIKGVKGEIYPIEETIFLATYEPVSL